MLVKELDSLSEHLEYHCKNIIHAVVTYHKVKQQRTDIETQLTRSWQAKTIEKLCMLMKRIIIQLYTKYIRSHGSPLSLSAQKTNYIAPADVCTNKCKACGPEIKDQ